MPDIQGAEAVKDHRCRFFLAPILIGYMTLLANWLEPLAPTGRASKTV
jgi:hypothetical protein